MTSTILTYPICFSARQALSTGSHSDFPSGVATNHFAVRRRVRPRGCPIFVFNIDRSRRGYHNMPVLVRSLAPLVIIIATTVAPAGAQEDLGQHKTGAQLFA